MCMRIAIEDLWLCQDCTLFAVNGDLTGIDFEKRADEVSSGVAELGPHLVPDFGPRLMAGDDPMYADAGCDSTGEIDFSFCRCDACHTTLGGSRHRFAVLAEEVGHV